MERWLSMGAACPNKSMGDNIQKINRHKVVFTSESEPSWPILCMQRYAFTLVEPLEDNGVHFITNVLQIYSSGCEPSLTSSPDPSFTAPLDGS